MKISIDNDARVDESSRGMRVVYVLCVLKIIDYMLWITVDQFNKKRVLLPQTLDISYSGVYGNKKFPTAEGSEVVRQGKRADVAWAGVEASRKFYFGILNCPVPESIEPAHMWILDPRAGAGLRNFIFRF